MRTPYFVKKNISLCVVVVVVGAAFALVKFLPYSEHVHYRFSPENYHVRKRGTESKHSRKFVAMAHLRKRRARQMIISLITEPKRAERPWLEHSLTNSCVTKARDIAWDAVFRVYTQLIINSPSWPTNSCKSLMGNRCKGIVDVDLSGFNMVDYLYSLWCQPTINYIILLLSFFIACYKLSFFRLFR